MSTPNETGQTGEMPRLGVDIVSAIGGLSLAELTSSPVLKGLGILIALAAEADLVHQGRQAG